MNKLFIEIFISLPSFACIAGIGTQAPGQKTTATTAGITLESGHEERLEAKRCNRMVQ